MEDTKEIKWLRCIIEGDHLLSENLNNEQLETTLSAVSHSKGRNLRMACSKT